MIKIITKMYGKTEEVLVELYNKENINKEYFDEVYSRIQNIRFELRAIKRAIRRDK